MCRCMHTAIFTHELTPFTLGRCSSYYYYYFFAFYLSFKYLPQWQDCLEEQELPLLHSNHVAAIESMAGCLFFLVYVWQISYFLLNQMHGTTDTRETLCISLLKCCLCACVKLWFDQQQLCQEKLQCLDLWKIKCCVYIIKSLLKKKMFTTLLRDSF